MSAAVLVAEAELPMAPAPPPPLPYLPLTAVNLLPALVCRASPGETPRGRGDGGAKGEYRRRLAAMAGVCRAWRDAVRTHCDRIEMATGIDVGAMMRRAGKDAPPAGGAAEEAMHALMCTSSPESARELCTNRPIEMHYLFLRGVAARVASSKWRARCTLPARAGSAQRRRQKRPCVLPSSECVLGGAACEMLLELPAVRLGKRLVVGRSNASVLLFDTCTLSPQHDDNGSSMPRTWLALGPLFYAARTGPGSGVRLGEPYDGGSLQADERVHWLQSHHVGLYVESETDWNLTEDDGGLPIRVYLHALDVCAAQKSSPGALTAARPLRRGGFCVPDALQAHCVEGARDEASPYLYSPYGVRVFLDAHQERGAWIESAALQLDVLDLFNPSQPFRVHYNEECPCEYHGVLRDLSYGVDEWREVCRALDAVRNESMVDVTVYATGDPWDPSACFGRARVEVWTTEGSVNDAESFRILQLDRANIEEYDVTIHSLAFVPDYFQDDEREQRPPHASAGVDVRDVLQDPAPDWVASALRENCLEFCTVTHRDTGILTAVSVRLSLEPRSATASVLRLLP